MGSLWPWGKNLSVGKPCIPYFLDISEFFWSLASMFAIRHWKDSDSENRYNQKGKGEHTFVSGLKIVATDREEKNQLVSRRPRVTWYTFFVDRFQTFTVSAPRSLIAKPWISKKAYQRHDTWGLTVNDTKMFLSDLSTTSFQLWTSRICTSDDGGAGIFALTLALFSMLYNGTADR